ncbi:MAG: TIGR03960 family B12-binding radical SAM protein [Anaerovoracaceae bacterium]
MNSKRLTEQEIYKLFRKYETPPHVIRHCRAVSDAAVRIAARLNQNGYAFDIDLIRRTGLVHDLMRTSEHHEIAGAEVLEGLGYHREAEIVRQHMTHRFGSFREATELDIVCLGDRTVREDQYVGVDARFEYLIHKPGENPDRTHHLMKARDQIHAYIREVEQAMGCSLDSLFRPSLDELLKQVEKPGRYIGGETNIIVKEPGSVDLRFAFAFPDMYEIGMSYVGLQILYHIVNGRENLSCERVFAPAPDMEQLMRKNHFPLFTLETKTPLSEMDVIGFTLQYEMSFTNVLNMIELSGLRLYAADRRDEDPLIIAGGPCAFNPEPLADFVDLFLIGDGEELLPEILTLYAETKKSGVSKKEFLIRAAGKTGVYVPSLYEPVRSPEGRLLSWHRLDDAAPERVRKAMIPDLSRAPYPEAPIVPIIEAVHDRAVCETFRGCTRGCRFCQAGMIYRPIRERTQEEILHIAESQIRNTGHDELSILSLSTSDYSQFEPLTMKLMEQCRREQVSLSLPSLRLDTFSFKVLNEIQKYKKSGLTFAPEAGTQRLRDVINKGITEQDIYDAVEQALELGWRHVKLYFMIGLPGETKEDLDGIADIARHVMDIHRKSGKGGRFNVTVSIANFVPKPHTPFQWCAQDPVETFKEKHLYLTERLRIKGVRYTYHDALVSKCEAILAKGGRETGRLLELAHAKGCSFDGWTEYFDREKWQEALDEWDVDYRSIYDRALAPDETLPWDLIDCGVSKEYLLKEYERSQSGTVTADCRDACRNCGISHLFPDGRCVMTGGTR